MKTEYWIILMGIGLCFVVGGIQIFTEELIYKNQTDYFDDVGLSSINLTTSKYEIRIDCLWLSEHPNDITVWFPKEVIELCKLVYPDLNYTLNPNQEQNQTLTQRGLCNYSYINKYGLTMEECHNFYVEWEKLNCSDCMGVVDCLVYSDELNQTKYIDKRGWYCSSSNNRGLCVNPNTTGNFQGKVNFLNETNFTEEFVFSDNYLVGNVGVLELTINKSLPFIIGNCSYILDVLDWDNKVMRLYREEGGYVEVDLIKLCGWY